MSDRQSRLDRVDAWLERENAKHDAIANARPTWWHLGKLVLGILLVLRSIGLVMEPSSGSGYALALLLVAGGTAFIFEGGQMLWRRWTARQSRGSGS